jgi:hypothetical protein
VMGDNDALRGHAYYFPFFKKEKETDGLFATGAPPEITPNLSAGAIAYLQNLSVKANLDSSSMVWKHALAIGYSPAFLTENADGLRGDWPRIPLPATSVALSQSANLGGHLVSLLDTEVAIPGVTTSLIRLELKVIGSVSTIDGKQIKPVEDLKCEAGWGHKGMEDATMPGKGKIVEREYTDAERDAIGQGATTLGITLEQALAQLGEITCDVYLNERVYWKCVPTRVWDYTIGGYQVIKKWLSYREHDVLGRSITAAEAHYVRDMARRLAAICLLQPQLDVNYAAVKSGTYNWTETKDTAAVPPPVQV